MQTQVQKIVGGSLLLLSVAGCHQPEDPEDFGNLDETSAGHLTEAGDGDGDGDGDGEFQGCLIDPLDGKHGLVHQCDGNLGFVIGGHIALAQQDDTFCPDPPNCEFGGSFLFGPGKMGDSYVPPKGPKVMACCSPDDPQVPLDDKPHWRACQFDSIETMCRSLVERAHTTAEELGGVAGNQLTALGNWIASHQDECITHFYVDSGLIDLPSYATIPGDINEVIWVLPNDNAWSGIDDPFVTLDWLEIYDWYLPPNEADQRECYSSDDNSDATFDKEPPPGVPALNLLAGSASSGGPVTDTGTLSSQTTGCDAENCSYAVYTLNRAGVPTLEDIHMFSDGPATITDGTATYFVEQFTVKLRWPEEATDGRRFDFIPPGQAFFVVTGFVDGDPTILVSARNSTDIIARPQRNGDLKLSSFTIEFLDPAGAAWTLDVSATEWNTPRR